MTTLQWVLSSCALILAATILGRALEGRVSARLRYALWLVVLARLLIPVQLFTAPVNFIPQPQVPEAMEQDSIYVLPTGSVPVEKASEVGAYVTEDGKIGMMTSMGYARLENDGKTVVRYLDKVSPMDILMTVWKLGAVFMLAVVAASNIRFSHRLRRLRAPLKVEECKLPVYRAEGLVGPCLFGLLRPAIYVTEEVLSDEAALRHVLTHESTHYRHGDHVWSALRGVALAIHWWNPLVWLAVAWSKQDGELACDEGALMQLGDAERTAYGVTLLKLVSAPAKPADLLRFTTTMTGGMKEMKRRIERIACKRKHLVILSAVLVTALSVLAACSFAAPKDDTTVSDEARQVIEVMMTAPNEDLIPKQVTILGGNYTEAEKAALKAESDRVIGNWEAAVGEFFSEKAVISGLNNNWLNAFQTRAEIFGKEYAVVDMVQTFKDEKREEVDVTYTADGEEHHILVRLRINTDGKFYEVEFDYADESIEGHVNILSGPEEPDEVGGAGTLSAKAETPAKNYTVSEEAQQVIKVMMTAPNEELVFNMDFALNSRPTEEEEAAARGERNRVLRCWEEAVGKYFSEGAVSEGLNSSALSAFQTRSRDFQKEFAVVDMVQTAKSEDHEEVAVTYTANGEEHHILVRFEIESDGKFGEVSYDLVDAPGSLKPLLLYIIGIADEPDDAARAQAAANEAAKNEAAANGDPFSSEAVEKAFGELIAYRTDVPLTLTMETAAGEKDTYSISSHNDFNVEHVSLYLSEDWQYSPVSEADWNALSTAEKGTVMTLEDRSGKVFRCCSGSDLLCLTMYGEMQYLRCESTNGSNSSIFDFVRMIADDAEISQVWDSAVVDGSVTNLEEVTELLMQQVAENYLALPSWVNGKPQDVMLVKNPQRVFDAYWGEPAQFCCDMGFMIALDDVNSQYWQAGAGLGESVGAFDKDYYEWGRQALIVRDVNTNLWYIRDKGTGGYSVNLPGYSLSVGTENYLGDAPLEDLLDMILLTEGFTHDYLLPKYALQKSDDTLSGINEFLAKRTEQERETICASLAEFVQGEYAGNSEWTLKDLQELLAQEYQAYLD